MAFRILCIGDVMGEPGVTCLEEVLPLLRERVAPDLVVVNGENAAQGMGLSAKLAKKILARGVDVVTTGNHVWRKKDLIPIMENDPRVLRPANFPSPAPGVGFYLYDSPSGFRVAVVNMLGRVFMNPIDDPFSVIDALLDNELVDTRIICVDFHAEATSEKQAFARHVDGRVSAVVGTHTHVQTADEKILPGGTVYITDLGMTGPHDSIIGMETKTSLNRLRTQRHWPYKVASNDVRLQGLVIDIDEKSGKGLATERLDIPMV